MTKRHWILASNFSSFLPSNNKEKPPCINTQDEADRTVPELDTIIPDRPNQAFDMLKVITLVVDDGYFFELLKDHAKNCIIGFARFNGRPAGIVANRPDAYRRRYRCGRRR